MSIASEISRIKTNIENTYINLQNNNITVPSVKNSENLSATVSDVIPFIPSNCSGLIFWIDGDCNTRHGVNRNKKYFENLVWNEPYSTSTGNIEYILNNGSSNSWNSNLLECKNNFYSYYPMLHASSFTYEIVCKLTAIPEDYVILIDSYYSYGNLQLFLNSSSKFNTYYRTASNTSTGYTVDVANNTLSYIVVTYNAGNYFLKTTNYSNNRVNSVTVSGGLRNHTQAYNTGFGARCSTSTTPPKTGNETIRF